MEILYLSARKRVLSPKTSGIICIKLAIRGSALQFLYRFIVSPTLGLRSIWKPKIMVLVLLDTIHRATKWYI
jgi:hypothetical protein